MNAQMPDAQRRTQTEQRKQLEGLERLAEQRVAAESDKRKEDEVRAQYFVGVQKKLQEAEIKARQDELRRVHDERAAKIRAEYDVELLRLKEEHAQAQAAHQQAVAEREEKLRLLQSAQEQVNTQAGSRIQMSHSTSLLNSAGVPTEPLRVSTVIAPVLAKLDQLVDVTCQMVHANQRQAEPVESRDKTTTAQNSSQNNRTKSSAQISISTSRRSSNACMSRSKTSDDNDWGSDSSSSRDSSQDELEGQFDAAAQTKRSDAGLGTRAVVQAIVPRDALGKFDEQGSLDNRVDWWERFKYYATMMPWDEKTQIVQLRMRLSGSLKDWCAQLHDSTRSDWKKLSHVFKKEWCRSIASKAESFYSMEMHYSETIRRLADSSNSEKPIDLVREPVRDRSKSQALCAFAYVGPALPCWCDDNSKCINSANQASDHPSLTEVEDSSSVLEFENNVEFALIYGNRYGWWSDHVLVGGKHDTAMVHGAIFNRRTQIWMDTGAMTSIISLDFARKLKLKLRRGYRLRVSGVGDVPKYATAKATIKLTLGVGLIYVVDIWVGNIGAGLDCLLGMDFMIAAGVRLCARKGVVRLQDEESLFLVGATELDHVGLEIDVSLAETIRLQPGRSVILPVKYHQAEPDKTVAWAGRGGQWVTQFIYGSGRKPKAVKVVNISDQVARITQHTVVACLVENEHFPQGKFFVRPWSRKYREWSALAYAAEPSTEYLKLEELVARQSELRGPPAVERPTYTWPKKLLLAKRPSKKDDVQSAGPEPKVSVYMVNTNPPAQPKSMLSQGRHTSIWLPLPPGDPLFMSTQPKLTTVTGVDEDSQSEPNVAESIPTSDDSELEVVSRLMAGGGTTAQGAQRDLESVFKAESLDFVADLVHRLRESFTRYMRLESNLSDEAAMTVYFHKGAELLYDIGGRLVALPELNDLGPKANMTTADIGKPGVVIPEMEAQVRTVLERHHSSFQGERIVVPGPVRAKRPPRKDGDELGGVDPRASAYRMNALPQGQSEGVPSRIGQDDGTQSWRSTSRTSVAPRDVSSELARSDRAEGEAGIAKAKTENDPASDESEPEVVSRVMIDECTTTHGAQKELAKVFKAQPVDFAVKPVFRLKESIGRCMRLEMVLSDEAEATVYFYEGTELLNGLRNELAVLLKQKDLIPKADLTTADIGETGVTTKAMEAQARAILEKHHDNFLEDGNAVLAPVRRVVGDFNVADAKPVARRFRSIRPEHLRKAYDQLEKLFQTELIEYSHSEWASPIVIRMKKNGDDIRTCIDYRIAIQLIKLTHYPLPLIDDLLIGFKSVLWVLSLAMAKRLWAVPMTLRAKHFSVLICLLRHFQWTEMLLGLKNAPPICQLVLVNCLWSFVRLPASEAAQMDVDGLACLGIDVGDSAEADLSTLIEGMTVFGRNVPSSPQLNSVRGERPYICDIGYGAETWEQLCVDLDRRLYRLRYWGTSVSLLKNKFGKKWFPHEIEADRIRAQSKIAEGVTDLPSPSPLRDVQPFLASLNYYDEFIESLPVIAAVLNKLTDEQIRSGRDLGRGMEAFGILKRKIVSTPLLRGPDSQKSFVNIIHANPWAACAVLGQESDGVFFPVHITGRVLHDHKLRYLPAENEVVALIRALRVFRTKLAGTNLIKVYTRYSMLKWICTSRSLEGRCRQWAVCLAPWPLEILKVQQDDDGLAAIMGAQITPRDQLDQNADNLIPVTGRIIQSPPVRLEMLGSGCEGWLIRFDGHAKKSDRWGSAGCILWELLSWDVVQARGFHFADVTVNATEYNGMIEGSKMALVRGISELVIVGDSRIAIQQARGLIQCLKPRLRMFFSEFEDQRQEFKSIELVHVKRGFNAAANYLASKIWTIRHSFSIDNSLGLAQLRWLSRITEKLIRGQKTKRAEPNLEPSSVPDAKVDVVRGHVSLAQADECFSPKSDTFVITRSCTRAEKTPAEVEVVDPDSNVRDAAETAEAQARFILMQVGDELPEPNAQ